MSNDPFNFTPEGFDWFVEYICKPPPPVMGHDGTLKALAERFGTAAARQVVFLVACDLLDKSGRLALLGRLKDLVFVARQRQLPPGPHIEAAQDELLALYSWLLGMLGQEDDD